MDTDHDPMCGLEGVLCPDCVRQEDEDSGPHRLNFVPSDAHIPIGLYRKYGMSEADLKGDYDVYTDRFFVPVLKFFGDRE